MGDEDEPHGARLGLGDERLPDLRLGHGVQHSGDLVGDEVARVRAEGPGDAEALHLAAGQLMGIARKPCVADAQKLPQTAQLLLACAAFGETRRHAHARIQRQLRMLPDELHRARATPRQRGAIDEHLARPGRQIARQHAAERRLTGAGRRGQLHALAGGNGEGDIIENGTTVEGDGEVAAF